MTAKGFANFSIALFSLVALDPGLAEGVQTVRPAAPGPAPDPDTRRRGGQGQPGDDERAIDSMPRSTGPADR